MKNRVCFSGTGLSALKGGKIVTVAAILIWLIPCNNFLYAQVKVVEETMIIPTYPNNPPNTMPRFYQGKGHQGVQRREYPYPVDDNITFVKKDVEYRVIHVENEYIDIGIIPELGGRIYYAVDKTNGYKWIYHNNVVKPSLIGMLGNWISGSLAWGYPHHHGPNTVKPMDYKVEEHPDGSKTVWIADTDSRHRLSIVVGYTVWPNSSVLEMTIHPMNNTPVSNSFLFWANPSVHVDTTYQVIFPPSVQYITFHAKRDMTTWPIADGIYNNYDYKGTDITWWKNTFVPTSFFSWDPREGYFGGYDHGKHAGTVWVGNRYISPGMKYWADGNNPSGRQINSGLTDNDGQYIELMAGLYTDNQPDYSWIQPYENKDGKMVWFPMRELAGIKYANRNGALNLTVAGNNTVQLRINTTSPHNQAKLVLKSKGNPVLQETIDISPAKPYVNNKIVLPAGNSEDDLDVSILGENGEILMDYRPAEHHPPDYPKPDPLKPFPAPPEFKTVEELYLAGLRLNQFYNSSVDPMPYYMEALKRDPGNYNVNTQLGILEIKNYNWTLAGEHLQKAVDRITSNYTRPKDCEGLYYLAIALRAQGRTDEAYDLFYRSTWDAAWHTPAYYQLAEMDCEKGDFNTALEHLNRSLTKGTENIQVLNLKAVVLRKLKKSPEAEAELKLSLERTVINHQALNELYNIFISSGNKPQADKTLNELSLTMRDDVQAYLELSTKYMNCGFFPEAIDLLTRLEFKGINFPMVYYYMGYCWSMSGSNEKAIYYYRLAGQKPHDYCFPFRAEEIFVLEDAMKVNPKDARAPYYLGNLLYEKQPLRAVKEWEKSRELDNSFYIVHRNLAIAYKEIEKDNKKALASIEKAVACNRTDPRLLFEVDELYELNKMPVQKRYDFLKQNAEIAKQRSETLLRLATRSVEYGKYTEAIDIITRNKINESEGARTMQNTFLNAYTLRGLGYFKEGNYKKAQKDFETALTYPIGTYGRPRFAQLYYLEGIACEKTQNPAKAKEFFERAIAVEIAPEDADREYLYYKALALKKTGRLNEAEELFRNMLKYAQETEAGNLFFTQFEGGLSQDYILSANHYFAGLAFEGLGDIKKAKEEFTKALDLNPGNVWSKYHLSAL